VQPAGNRQTKADPGRILANPTPRLAHPERAPVVVDQIGTQAGRAAVFRTRSGNGTQRRGPTGWFITVGPARSEDEKVGPGRPLRKGGSDQRGRKGVWL